jgi:tRNA (guanine37-N1)-methyltransferase
LETNDVVYDVFAGVGPFSIPAVTIRKVNHVLANDLNPHSYRYLIENYTLNNRSKTKSKQIQFRKSLIRNTTKTPPALLGDSHFKFSPLENFTGFNLDGKDFIRTVLKYHLVELLNYRQVNEIELGLGKFYVLMNLPAMSLEFLASFTLLYTQEEAQLIRSHFDAAFLEKFNLNIFCYHFAKTEDDELNVMRKRIAEEIFSDQSLTIDSKWIRKVAPNKDMYCSMFKLGFRHFFTSGEKKKLDKLELDETAPSNKILKTE